jgi:hypothetical protein
LSVDDRSPYAARKNAELSQILVTDRYRKEDHMPARVDFSRAVADTSAVIVAIGDDQLDAPTPSPSYTVGDLIEHVDGLSAGLQLTARKSPPPPPGSEEPRDGDASQLADGWPQRIPRQLEALVPMNGVTAPRRRDS